MRSWRSRRKAAGSLGRRPWRMLMQNRESPDAESEPKKFWRTPRDMMDDVSTSLHEDARWSSTTGALNPSSRTPTPVSLPSRTSTASSPWEREGPVMPAPPEPFLPDMGVDTMPKEDGVESLWTEAPGPSGADTAPSPDDTTEGTMSSESLPLIFEPLEESAAQLPAAATASAGAPLSEADPELPFATETDKPSHAPPPMTPDVEHLDASRHSDDPDEDENSEDSPEDEESDEDPTEMSRTEPAVQPHPTASRLGATQPEPDAQLGGADPRKGGLRFGHDGPGGRRHGWGPAARGRPLQREEDPA
ncbi:cell surface glycoprotein 1-like isoform X4 [Phycodurus eques]|uniref:cell surface glycoprotein 1-like isoform X4 n=1 Tax=Phycodurus eques TaxID=693459 RepID=UPI002ACE2713|nr:cell surface glycoprotein 1-like isoform X4 [Phycodurus eques]